ncbi:16S rRNA (uracil(1498)-N(3))-methyltransferase [Acidothermaceae bacterium B102]|nr:16S rRNA (uracil(1498)-N(3))-methyltransferase [Acidothermaceae bacterium B102]
MTAPVFRAVVGTATRHRLDGDEGRHAATVRRIRAGERIDLCDGAGTLLECVVSLAGKDFLDVDVVTRHESPRPTLGLTVVQALPKGDRGELAVDVMTEVGVDTIVPWSASRCVTQWSGERGDKARRKWEQHAAEASKQARRSWFSTVAPLASTADVAALVRGASLAVVLHESATTSLAAQAIPTEGSVVLVVGPEGGIIDNELVALTEAGAVVCRMGPTVMRTSTAGVAAAAVVLARAGRWS